MSRWPLHDDVREVLLALRPAMDSLPDTIHEQERAHVLEWRPKHFPGTVAPESIEDRLSEHEEKLGDTLVRAKTFDWGRCWVVHAAPEEEDDA